MDVAVIEEDLRKSLARVLSGERDAYAQIVAALQDPLRSALGGLARSTEELEDFCHLAFVAAYFRLADYDSKRGAFRPWFFTLARNAALEELRRRRAEGRRLHRYVERGLAETSDLDRLEQAREALERCLAHLEPGEARILRDHYRSGRGCEEIGALVGKTALAVRKILQRLRERLRACVERRMLGEAP